jgi:hypothetical protein
VEVIVHCDPPSNQKASPPRHKDAKRKEFTAESAEGRGGHCAGRGENARGMGTAALGICWGGTPPTVRSTRQMPVHQHHTSVPSIIGFLGVFVPWWFIPCSVMKILACHPVAGDHSHVKKIKHVQSRSRLTRHSFSGISRTICIFINLPWRPGPRTSGCEVVGRALLVGEGGNHESVA